MNETAFVLLTLIFAGYVLLDGYDLGVGALHLLVARSDTERAASLATIGPFWNGNEVALIAGGGMLFAFFPLAYAAAFSGFYLPFMVVLWLLMGRGMAMELRGHLRSDLWRGFWDVLFSICSILLALLLGVALGNVMRGVPLDAHGYFTGTFRFLLNGYALLVGFFALAAVALHGAAFVAWRAQGDLAQRAVRAVPGLWIAVLVLLIVTTWATLRVHPVHLSALLWIAPVVGLCALLAVRWPRIDALRFAATSVFLFALMISASATLFPYLLPAYPIGSGGLDIQNAAPGGYALRTGIIAFTIGLGAVLVYATLAARRLLTRVAPGPRGESH